MRYSVVSRFQGTLLGAVLGELASNSSHQLQGAGALEITSLHWSPMAILCASSLINLGRFDQQDWRQRLQQEFKKTESSHCGILATLPVALFFHDNIIKLRKNLLLAAQIWQDEPLVRDGILAVGYAIAQSLTETLAPSTLISQTIEFIGETSTSLPEKLLKINHLLESGAGLERVQSEISKEEKLSYAVALAFYCSLSTIEDFRLSVRRASQIHHCPYMGGITGALSGAYNSLVGIPVTWQLMLLQASGERKQTQASQMLELADTLTAVWSGVYNLVYPDEVTEKGGAIAPRLGHLQATAAPRVIRSR
jgi:ADP-ribosylglycohydrolase